MIPVTLFKGQTVAVFGLARTGISAARALIAGGASVLAWDDGEKARDAAQAAGLSLAIDSAWPWAKIAALVLSPGVPLTHPEPHRVVRAAHTAGVEVIGDMELFVRTLDEYRNGNGRPPLVCVTGTNGKSTTTALIGHLLSRNGYNAEVGGNIGKPVLELEPPAPKRAYVLEVSSYQIELTPSLKPDVGVLTNITPDHLDRHGTMEHYVELKRRLFLRQGAGQVAVIGVDDRYSADTCTQVSARGGVNVIPVAIGKVLGRGVYVIGGTLYDGTASPAVAVADLKQAPSLLGAHNWQNAAASFAAVRGLVKDAREMARALITFPGLHHRIEQVGRIGKVSFVNDSKATNADAAEKALVCFTDIHWIAGGLQKEGGIEALRQHFPRVAKAYLIGKAQDAFAKTIGTDIAVDRSGDLETAMRRALADALNSRAEAPVVLLSPACASFDQFRDYEERGDTFRRIFEKLSAEQEARASA